MSDSEDYGESDDEALIIAATQVEEAQRNAFAASPRPAKKAKLFGQPFKPNGLAPPILPPKPSALRPAARNPFEPVRPTIPNGNAVRGPGTIQSGPFKGPLWRKEDASNSQQAVVTPIGPSEDYIQETDSDDEAMVEVASRVESAATAMTTQSRPKSVPMTDLEAAEELANLPSDAFSDPGISPPQQRQEPVYISSSQPQQPDPAPRPRIRAPLHGLRQTTLFGGNVQMPASQANKRLNFPAPPKEEPPTHHKLNTDELLTWVYPTNLGKTRDYQFNIVQKGLFNNLLVALPTGLGKTFIAATIMLNWWRWTKDAQIVFVAPTKPLVEQQVQACFNIAGIPRSDTTMLTGDVHSSLRAEEWQSKRVFFMTPQTFLNDLTTGTADPKKIVLVVVDEAHRGTGGYAYVKVIKFIRRFNESFRVLALTATPGGNVETVQHVIDGLDISHIEIRTEQSLDIREYVHKRRIDKLSFENSDEMLEVMDLYSKAVKPVLEVINGQNAYWVKDPLQLTPYGLTMARQQWNNSDAGRHAAMPVKGMVNAIMTLLASIAHSMELLKYHGIGPFYQALKNFREETHTSNKSKWRKKIDEHPDFERMMVRLQAWTSDPEFVGHPKLVAAKEEILNHFMDAGEGTDREQSSTRIMLFAHFRDSAEEIAKVLGRHAPMIRPHVFVGQASSKNSEGMSQKKQLQIIEDFKSGKFNVLIATSIGEEGLDIGEVDLIICYDSKSSPIRMLQRMGRTGRKRAGKIIFLQMKGKEEDDAAKAMDSYEKVQDMIAAGDRFHYHEDLARRIIPRDVNPRVDMRPVEIPIENTQRTPSNFLPVPTKRARGTKAPKRPPKKFHMPDGVRTGFTTASAIDGDDVDLPLKAPKRKRKEPEPDLSNEPVEFPTLEEVVLNEEDTAQLETRFQYAAFGGDDDVVSYPRLDTHPLHQRSLAPTRYVPHGQVTKALVDTLKRVAEVDRFTTQKWFVVHDEDWEPDAGDIVVEDRLPLRPASDAEDRLSPGPGLGVAGRPLLRSASVAVDSDDLESLSQLVGAPAPPRPQPTATAMARPLPRSASVVVDSDDLESLSQLVRPPPPPRPQPPSTTRPRPAAPIELDLTSSQSAFEALPSVADLVGPATPPRAAPNRRQTTFTPHRRHVPRSPPRRQPNPPLRRQPASRPARPSRPAAHPSRPAPRTLSSMLSPSDFDPELEAEEAPPSSPPGSEPGYGGPVQQSILLGSTDTPRGSRAFDATDEAEVDSDMVGFVVDDDAPIEIESSSAPVGTSPVVQRGARGRGRAVVESSSGEEESDDEL
ncbi:P-loop containing nucleoside triphosphate hydrolase protein [Trichodelitschia bisporula]|uniref:ATP-dependent DNA helicase n=1 Tax=Trichodelitschia bisporula TaxID=703511 RepID=A0A6G1I7L9_9PEZI|nr:P-loop containing nucleoside triphosphate hydrolase protein [Trichodelitschia bisporula]